MRIQRWPNEGCDTCGADGASGWQAALAAALRWLVVLLIQHFGG